MVHEGQHETTPFTNIRPLMAKHQLQFYGPEANLHQYHHHIRKIYNITGEAPH